MIELGYVHYLNLSLESNSDNIFKKRIHVTSGNGL